jgi:hypothetical protein
MVKRGYAVFIGGAVRFACRAEPRLEPKPPPRESRDRPRRAEQFPSPNREPAMAPAIPSR